MLSDKVSPSPNSPLLFVIVCAIARKKRSLRHIPLPFRSSTSSWKPWRWKRLDQIFSMRDIYINSNLNPLTKFTSSSRSTKFEDIFPWDVSQMITKTIAMSMRIVISYATKRGIPSRIWWKVNGNWDNSMIRISQWRESLCSTNTSVKRKKEIQKSRTVRIAVWDPSGGKLTIWVRSFEKL